MLRVAVEPEFEAWREIARRMLREGYAPEQVDLQDVTVERPLSLALEVEETPVAMGIEAPHVPKAFLEKARVAAVHRDPERWNLLYRILWRLQSTRGLLHVEVDDDVALLGRLVSQVHHDVHKMHAFVRFRKIDDVDGEHFVAWYRPDNRIVPLVAPFFQERFAVMRWTILTPDASVDWDPATKALRFGAGVGREHAPQDDEVEGLWKSYYGSIFNPARLNPRMMRGEMPVRYWGNLPEAAIIPHLIQKAEARVGVMMAVQSEKTTAEPFVPEHHTLKALREALPSCKGCSLFECATQVVPGKGAAKAHLMLVGEQPGDQEDLQGEPFIGPAGGVLRKVLEELRIDPADVYMTNAVKHFKFKQQGKRRLHENPRMSEINACKPWLMAELDAIKPRVVLCLGASASKSLLGGTFTLMKSRGKLQQTPAGHNVFATIHPSAILRARDEQSREQLLGFLKDDLATAYKMSLTAP